jgi:serine protease
MKRVANVVVIVAMVVAGHPAAARVTRQCTTNWGNGEILIQAPAGARSELIAIGNDAARNPDLFFRIWEPSRARLLDFITFEDEVILSYDPVQDTEEIARAIRADPVLGAFGVRSATASGWSCFATSPPPQKVTITEYRNRFLDHYFLSSTATENALIDAGAAGEGWERTGEAFATTASDPCSGGYPVFRFYGRAANSHFFTVDAAECGAVRNQDPGWLYEGVAFGAFMPANGVCPARTRPLYRLYNGRAAQTDSNHRFVARPDLYAQMQARGWIGEGVALCLDDRGL